MASWKNVQYKNGQYRTSEGGGGSSTLSGLDDVTISSASNGQVLKYNSTSSKWVNANDTSVTALEDLTDVDIDSKSDGDVLTYNEAQDRWEAAEPLINDVALTDLTDTSVSSPSNGQVLTYDENEDAWVNANPTSGASDLDDLGDVTISSATNGQVLKYDSSSSKWVNANESGGGASTLNDLTDVDTTGVSDNNVLAYSSGQSKWVPATVSGGNVDDVTVNGTSVVTNKVAQITSYKELTRAEYDLLPNTKYSDGIMYCITDGFNNPNGFPPLIYSTEEREVGVWIDGKPLYEKTITFVSYEAGYVDVSNLYVDKMVSSGGFIIQTNGNHVNIPYGVHTGDFALAYYNSSNGRLYCSYGGSFNVCDWYVTMQYTKTTDTAGSGKWATDGGLAKHYSTSEQIIGTWIDGKPLYEKTFEKTLTATSTGDGYGTAIQDSELPNCRIRYIYGECGGIPNGTDYVRASGWSGYFNLWYGINSANVSYNYRWGDTQSSPAIITVQYTKIIN